MKRISVQLGFYFLIVTLLIESVLFILLYYSLVNTRVNEEMNALLKRGNSHRDVLEKYFDSQTISHVALMESEAETTAVITNADKKVLAKSNYIDSTIKMYITKMKIRPSHNGTIIDSHWKTSNYICTVSPIVIGKKVQGYVYMFLGTNSIKQMVNGLTKQFMIAGLITFLLTVITIFLLSRLLTKPLIRMKHATEKMSRGDLSISLRTSRNDEIGELASAIQTLANDLHYMKKERSEFLASVAHELRTPLTYVKGYAEIAQKRTTQPTEREKYLSIIKEEADYITNLVQDLFILAQMEKHNFLIEAKRIDLEKFLNRIVTKVNGIYVQKHLTVSLTCPPSLFITLDERRFEQVIMNILNNAYRHSAEYSVITITVTAYVSHIKISIQDTGEGIPPEDIPHIFERFYRVDKARSRATGGTGLGLAIVKEIVELHDGHITVSSKLNKGTCFTITLPREKESTMM
ncbi:sensor histidine kinase [Bacillus cytotoxicus]|uniref:histidine kinase n=1 Tax=Bacillus cytotoxicus (strain DSM 22905 / CIP 110041 / 391-98 / NVH 391-98) TaxID=315749 RepID=A7GL87_BACCN|nr:MULTISPECIES: HAMP domain-containing sensor histidine kinase [Bacillus cereus group]ABS20895.1 integral membrane sensor signal transduction histidine kinase [Bacillus cytotoxicus NVH 391-98]AWC31542.1 two-component sensor histidine kinase [Bacillus cytotoxicus]AWC35582.1 two-component sensor histidine kinase [Bacillus cytotoxicus]AWC43631.1 two-component sensor histidine kinase [Bacillus cytotoxicus]AWC59814.1 two-component sensor histidine kinase [Bacillus cytotoxicus]